MERYVTIAKHNSGFNTLHICLTFIFGKTEKPFGFSYHVFFSYLLQFGDYSVEMRGSTEPSADGTTLWHHITTTPASHTTHSPPSPPDWNASL